MKVKLIIARTKTETVYFNYGDDYSDVNRVLVEDHSPFEEVDYDHDLLCFINDFNNDKNNKKEGRFAFLINMEDQVSPQSAIEHIVEKRKDELEKERERERKAAEEREKKKRERELKKLAKTKAEKLALLEQLKKELE